MRLESDYKRELIRQFLKKLKEDKMYSLYANVYSNSINRFCTVNPRNVMDNILWTHAKIYHDTKTFDYSIIKNAKKITTPNMI